MYGDTDDAVVAVNSRWGDYPDERLCHVGVGGEAWVGGWC